VVVCSAREPDSIGGKEIWKKTEEDLKYGRLGESALPLRMIFERKIDCVQASDFRMSVSYFSHMDDERVYLTEIFYVKLMSC